MYKTWFCFVLVLCLTIGPLAARADDADLETLYHQAVAAMEGLPQPLFVTYQMVGTSNGLKVGLIVQKGNVWLNMQPGDEARSWTIRHRTVDYRSEMTDDSTHEHFVTERSFFDPTWYGAYRALHQGMLNYQDPAPPRDAAAVDTSQPLRTIAVASVIGRNVYSLVDRGSQACPNGDPGHALHLNARDHNPAHQLSDVIIDMQLMRFCMMQFTIKDAFGFHGTVETDYSAVGGYWLQTGGGIEGTLRAFGIATHHGAWRYRLVDMQFPTALQP